MRILATTALLVGLSVLSAGAAEAQEVRSFEQALAAAPASRSVRTLSYNSLLLPARDIELGGEMTFLTSGVPVAGGEGFEFSDVGFMTLNGRYSFGRVEIAGATELLLKQPGYMEEWVPQVGVLSTRVALGERQAIALNFAMGPLLLERGIWEGAELSIEAKREVHETLVFQGSLGGTFTHLNFAEPISPGFVLGEALASLEAILRTPRRGAAVSVSARLHVPFAWSPDRDDPGPTGFLDPSTRLDFNVVAVYSVVDDWDFYLRFSVIDRGEKDNGASMLPILDGGFDQQQTSIGVVYRWERNNEDASLQMAE